MIRTENYQRKNIRDFTDTDTVYIQKIDRGYMVTILAKFASFSKGIVEAEIIKVEPDWQKHSYPAGQRITARLGKCYLYGNSGDYARCNWFNKEGFAE